MREGAIVNFSAKHPAFLAANALELCGKSADLAQAETLCTDLKKNSQLQSDAVVDGFDALIVPR